MTGMWVAAFILQWGLLLLLAVLIVGVLRYLGFVQRNIHLVVEHASRFEEGDRISHFELADLEGLSVVSKALLGNNQKTLLLFLSTGCNGCKTVVRQVADIAKRKGGLKGLEWTFVFIYIGSRKSVKVHIANLPLDEVTVLIDEDGTLYQQYDIRSFPVAIAVDNRGTVIDQSRGPLADWLFNILNVSPLLQRSPLLTPVGDSSSDE